MSNEKISTTFSILKEKVKAMSFDAEQDRQKLLLKLAQAEGKKINLLIVGSTGCGKSSTINALFQTNKAKVGMSSEPETMDIEKYELNNLTIWDSPGLGDGVEEDKRHAKKIINLLTQTDDENKPLIDMVLVVIDGSSRDYGTTYQLLEQVIIPTLKDVNDTEIDKRILIAINQCDMAMKGRHWDHELNQPEELLINFLEEKVQSTYQRIYDNTGVKTIPIYYSAGYQDEMGKQYPYNLSKLLAYIVENSPKKKRMLIADTINHDPNLYKHDDGIEDYVHQSRKGMLDSLKDFVEDISEGISNVVEGISNVVEEVFDAVTGAISRGFDKVKSFFGF